MSVVEMREAKKHIQQFEAQYGMSLSELERQGLPENASVEAHEDYNRWFFWQSVLDRQEKNSEAVMQSGTTSLG
jgi:hypothetical protein